jgi:hypothetical protein
MKMLMRTLMLLVLALAVSGGVTGCAKKKVKAEAESNESRKGGSWNYDEAEKNMNKDNAESAMHKDCKVIKDGKYFGYYENEANGRHLAPHHDNCRKVDASRGLGEGYYESDELGAHQVGHSK